MNWASSVMSQLGRSGSSSKLDPVPKKRRVDKKPSSSDAKDSKKKLEVVTSKKEFDLNMEEVLEQWEVPDALRELLCNAEDETKLASISMDKVKECNIDFDEEGVCHIRDFGRGLHYKHFTQSENPEKLEAFDDPASGVVGRFGVGLKDGLGVLYRNGVKVLIRSKYQDVTLDLIAKHSFRDVKTLHAVVLPPSAPSMQGTDFALTGVRVADVEKAKEKFLRYNPLDTVKSVAKGSVLKKRDHNEVSAVYFRGLKLTDLTSDMLFSYNIKVANAELKKSMNRERQEVKPGAISGLIKKILTTDGDGQEEVTDLMCKNMRENEQSELCDELKWKPVKVHFMDEQSKRCEPDARRHEEALRAREEARHRENQKALEESIAAEKAKAQQAEALRRQEEAEEARRLQEEARQELQRKEEERFQAEQLEKQKEAERLRLREEHERQVAHEEEMARQAAEAREEAIRLGQEKEAERLRQLEERQRQEAREKDLARRAAEARLEEERREQQREAERLRRDEEIKRQEAHEKELAREAAEKQRKVAEARRVELEKQQLVKQRERREAQEKLRKKTREEEGIAEENRQGNVIMYVTFDEMKNPRLRQLLDTAKRSHKLVEVSKTELQNVMTRAEATGSSVLSFVEYQRKMVAAYVRSKVKPEMLTSSEREVWQCKDAILQLVGGCPSQVRAIVLAEKIHPFKNVGGCWSPCEQTIFIARSQLQCMKRFAGTLLHEAAHAESGGADATELFESQLTKWLGVLANQMIDDNGKQTIE